MADSISGVAHSRLMVTPHLELCVRAELLRLLCHLSKGGKVSLVRQKADCTYKVWGMEGAPGVAFCFPCVYPIFFVQKEVWLYDVQQLLDVISTLLNRV